MALSDTAVIGSEALGDGPRGIGAWSHAAAPKYRSASGPVPIHHEWRVFDTKSLPCGCPTVAEAAMAGLPGNRAAIVARTGTSVRSSLHQAACIRCGDRMVIVENESRRRRWTARAFELWFEDNWVEVAVPAQMICDLGLSQWGLEIARPTGVCEPAP